MAHTKSTRYVLMWLCVKTP